ncbi:MAG: hypothetical protein JWO82_994 [Akkermansiaceae bacterium]|nr:hypothetical protein [Akkermansiaceae bacterium]
MNPHKTLRSLGLLLAAAGIQAHAAVISTNTVNDDPLFFDASIAPSLVTNGQASLASLTGTTPTAGFPLGGVNNGSAVGASLPTADVNSLTFFDGLNSGTATVTFQLSQGYDITSISSIAGWGDTYFGSQSFAVLLETGSSGTFTSIGNFGVSAYTPTAPPGFPEVVDFGFSTRATLTDDSPGGVIASNVTGIRLVYSDPYPTIPQYNGTVIREISVTGTPAVPEAGSCLLGLMGGAAALARRRRA